MAPKPCPTCRQRLEQQDCDGHCRRCARAAGLLPPKLSPRKPFTFRAEEKAMRSRLCSVCHERSAQYPFRPLCRQCARKSGLQAPDKRLLGVSDATVTPARYVRHVTPPPLPPEMAPIVIGPREIFIDGITYDVVFSGRDTLRGSDAPANFGSSLQDTSRVVRP